MFLVDGAYQASFSTTVLSGANLKGAYLAHADLAGADLRGANLKGTILTRANLAGADLSGANLGDADLSDADLTGADLTQANLRGVTGLASARIDDVIWNVTLCPDRTNSDKAGGTCIGHLNPQSKGRPAG